MLWHDADSVEVRMAGYHPSASNLSSLLGQTAGIGTLKVTVGTLRTGLLTVHDARLRKSGASLYASAQLSESDLRGVLPGVLESVTPLPSAPGQLRLAGTAHFLLFTGTLDATVEPVHGRIVVVPDILPGLFSVTVWNDAGVYVDSVSGSPTADGLSVSAVATIR